MQDSLISFFNSNFFLALIALLVGIFAIGLYIKQKRDYKKDAANIILMEVRNAESSIANIKSTRFIDYNKLLLSNNSWAKYSYLFIKDLDRDEWDVINNFFNQCKLYDESIKQLKNSLPLQIEQKANHIQKTLVDLAREFFQDQEGYKDRRDKFLKIIESEPYWFKPSQPQNEVMRSLDNINYISTTTIGAKLKKIAGIRN